MKKHDYYQIAGITGDQPVTFTHMHFYRGPGGFKGSFRPTELYNSLFQDTKTHQVSVLPNAL